MIQKFFIAILCLSLFSCSWRGIPLETRSNYKPNSGFVCQPTETEIRIYRILFLLPIYRTNKSFELTNNEYVIETKSYAKPWDIGITTIGFLFSVNSSTDYLSICPWEKVEKSVPSGDVDGNLKTSKLAYWKSVGSEEPIESISFDSDDHRLSEESQNKLTTLSQKILKSEEKLQIVLYGKVNTTGDLGFQVRLLKRRYDEIKSLLTKDSIDPQSVLSIIGEKDHSSESKSNSTVQIYLIKN